MNVWHPAGLRQDEGCVLQVSGMFCRTGGTRVLAAAGAAPGHRPIDKGKGICMSRYFCNPVNMSYRYQFNEKQEGGFSLNREAADPSMILFKGKPPLGWSGGAKEWSYGCSRALPTEWLFTF